MTEPDVLAAVELGDRRLAALDDLLTSRGLQDSVQLHYGLDQSDTDGLEGLLRDDFAGHALDLVIDDASHRLAPTLRSFNVLFPALRPGGVYLVEDWSGLHQYDRVFEERLAFDPELRTALLEKIGAEGQGSEPVDMPLSALLYLLVMATSYAPEAVVDLDISDGWCAVTRGPAPLAADFDLQDVLTPGATRLLPATPDWAAARRR